MNRMIDTNFAPQLEMVESLRDGGLATRTISLDSLREADKLTVALRTALDAGVPMDELVSRSGLTPDQIVARVNRPLMTVESAADLAGVA